MILFGFDFRQHIDSLLYISDIVEKEKPETIIEFGTGDGFLALLLSVINIELYTFDIKKPKITIPGFQQKDILDNHGYIGNIIITSGKCLILCDNGNKIDEFAIFSQYAKSGDVIMVHDYFEKKSDMIIDNAWRTCEVIQNDLDLAQFNVVYQKPYIGWGVFKKI